MSEGQLFLLLAILIGLFAGLSIVCFHISMDYVSWLVLGTPTGQRRLATILGPAIGAVIATFLVRKVFRAAQGSGINHTKAALYVSDGYIPFSTVIGKFLACSVSIGSGNSLGPEDPSLHMGAALASWLGRLFGLGKENMRRIAAVGAAAGLAAAFNTPITAVLFVIEEVVGAWNAAVMGATVLSAVAAVVVTRWFLGDEPLFRVPQFRLTHPSELLIYAGIGLIGGLLGALFIRVAAFLGRKLHHRPAGADYWLPMTAGLMVGCAGIWLPQVLGAGYGAIDSALRDEFPWHLLLLLGLVKMIVTLLCFSAGTPGGMFAPTLFTGAMIGGGIGGLARHYWPVATSPTDAYVLVGMGTFFAGLFRAPMTSVFMVFEVSASYVIIVPVMIANTIAYLVSRQLQPVPFFTLISRMEGVDLPSPEQQREERVLRVEDAMQHRMAPLVAAQTPVAAALSDFTKNGFLYAFMPSGESGWSLVSDHALRGASAAGKNGMQVKDALMLEQVPSLYPDLSLDIALRRFDSHRVLPVLSRLNSRQILGTLTIEDIHRAYGIGPRDGNEIHELPAP